METINPRNFYYIVIRGIFFFAVVFINMFYITCNNEKSRIFKIIVITCSNDLSPLCLPQFSMSSSISCLTLESLHKVVNVPGILFS